MAGADPTQEVLLTSSFTFQQPTLWFPKARLLPDRLELAGWQLTGRYRRAIPLDHVLQVDAAEPDRLLVWLDDGQVLRLRLDEAPRWERALERRLDDDGHRRSRP